MCILDKINSKNLFWSLPTSKLPPDISEYKCELVVDELQVEHGERVEKMYLRFTHHHTKQCFQISIDGCNTPSSSIYEAEINIEDVEEPKTTLLDPFDSICFTTIHNYQRPQMKIEELQFNENSAYHSDDEELCNFFDFDSGIGQQEVDDEESLLDYAPENEKEVRHKVLMFMKNPANRFKKMKEIKAHLKKLRYNVPDNHLKAIITGYCGSHIMDKKRGFLVHEDFLSLEEKNHRRHQLEEEEKKEKETGSKKGSKKGTKKETKADKPGKRTIQITNEEVQKFAEENKSKEAKQALGLLANKTKKSKQK